MRCQCCDNMEARRYKGGDYLCEACVVVVKRTLSEQRFMDGKNRFHLFKFGKEELEDGDT